MPVTAELTDKQLDVNVGNYSDWIQLFFEYSTFPSVDFPWDPYLLKRCQEEIDPLLVFLNVRTVYKSPSGAIYTFDRHAYAVGDYGETALAPPDAEFRHVNFGLAKSPRPWKLLEILEGPTRLNADRGLPRRVPGPAYQLDNMYFHKLSSMKYWGDRLSKEEEGTLAYNQIMQKAARVEKDYREESNYRWDHDWAWWQREKAKMDVTDRRGLIAASGRSRSS